MKLDDKIELFKELNSSDDIQVEHFYNALEKCGAIKKNYTEYMTTAPVNCDTELLRLPTADYDLCCALLTMILREDYFNNGSFKRRHQCGQINLVTERIINLLMKEKLEHISSFSEKALNNLNSYYVYALVDPRNDEVFYIGKGTGNRVFSHEIESQKAPESEKQKLRTIQEIENEGLNVKRLIVNWGLNEEEAFASESTLINLLKYIPSFNLSNEVSGHHVHECLTVEEFERQYGAVPLKLDEIKHSIMVIKVNKLYRRGMSKSELYDAVRGYWSASLNSIKARKVEYVFGVYNGLIVAVYRPDEWHYCYEMIDNPQIDLVTPKIYEKLKNRVYFVCKDYNNLDEEGCYYLNKSIANLKVNQSSKNPISYISPK